MSRPCSGAAVEQPDPAGRAGVLDRECSNYPELRGRVEALMRARERRDHEAASVEPVDGATLEHTPPPEGEPGGLVTVDRPPPRSVAEGLGSRIGPYKLLQKIGEGGMGAVYMAEQVEPVRRKVALKIIKPGMDSDQVTARFEAERYRYLYIRILLETGNRAGVRRACEDLLKGFGKTTEPAQAESVAWYCALAPDAVADHDSLVRLAEAALAGHPRKGKKRSDLLMTLGAALFRAGRFEEAIRRLDESVQSRGDEGDPRGFAFLALAHHGLGHHDQAERWLSNLVAAQPREGFDFSRDDVEIRILCREARSEILGSRPTAPSPMPTAPTNKGTSDPGNGSG